MKTLSHFLLLDYFGLVSKLPYTGMCDTVSSISMSHFLTRKKFILDHRQSTELR